MIISQSGGQKIQQVRVIAAALMIGVFTMMVVAASLVVVGGFASAEPRLSNTALVAVAGLVGMLLLLAPRLQAAASRTEPGAAADTVTQRWVTGTIVGLAVREGAGLLGLVAAFFAGSLPWVLGFGTACLVAMGLAWPRGMESRGAE